jgi:hypothetical protein
MIGKPATRPTAVAKIPVPGLTGLNQEPSRAVRA